IENTFEKKEDLKLADNDLVYVFNQSQIATLAAAASAALGTTSSASQNPIATFRAANSSGSSSSSTSSQSSTSPTNGTPPTGGTSTGNSGTTATQSSGNNSTTMPIPPAGAVAQNAPAAAIATALQAGNAPPQPSTTPTAGLPSTGAAIVNLGQAQATEGATGGAAATVATNNSAQAQVSLDQIAASLG